MLTPTETGTQASGLVMVCAGRVSERKSSRLVSSAVPSPKGDVVGKWGRLWEYIEGSRRLSRSDACARARAKVFSVVKHPDQNTLGTPRGEEGRSHACSDPALQST